MPSATIPNVDGVLSVGGRPLSFMLFATTLVHPPGSPHRVTFRPLLRQDIKIVHDIVIKQRVVIAVITGSRGAHKHERLDVCSLDTNVDGVCSLSWSRSSTLTMVFRQVMTCVERKTGSPQVRSSWRILSRGTR